jgi:heat shock protein HslJ
MKKFAIIFVLVLIIAGTAYIFVKNFGNLQSEKATASQLIRGWALESYNGTAANGSINFKKDGRFEAQLCNLISGSYAADNGGIKFSGVAGTLALCTDENLSEADTAFVQMTKSNAAARLVDGKLHLQSGNDKLIFY